MRRDRRGLLAGLLAVATAPFLINGYVNARVAGSPVLYWGFELLCWMVIPALVAVAVHRGCGVRARDVGLSATLFGERRPAALAAVAAVMSVAYYLLYVSAHAVFDGVFASEPFFEYEGVIPESGVAKAAVVAYFAISAGVVEELLYRGALFRLAQTFARPAAVFLVVSPLVFASVHWEGGATNLAATYVLGVFASSAYLWLRNLWPLIVAHTVTDVLWFL